MSGIALVVQAQFVLEVVRRVNFHGLVCKDLFAPYGHGDFAVFGA